MLILFLLIFVIGFWLCVRALVRGLGGSETQASFLATMLTIFMIDD